MMEHNNTFTTGISDSKVKVESYILAVVNNIYFDNTTTYNWTKPIKKFFKK